MDIQAYSDQSGESLVLVTFCSDQGVGWNLLENTGKTDSGHTRLLAVLVWLYEINDNFILWFLKNLIDDCFGEYEISASFVIVDLNC